MVSQIIVKHIRTFVNDIERIISFLGNRFPPPGFNVALINSNLNNNAASVPEKRSIFDIMKDGFLWAVPKKRVSLERRHKKKYGNIDVYYKLLIPQNDLEVCIHCGHDYKRGYLCKNCFNKVMDETKQIQDRILEELKLDPVDKEVVVLYEKEESESQEHWQGKRIVEMNKERPAWFSKNLVQKTTTTTSDCKEIKPEQLG